jgi:DnaK suppressor protein
MNSLLNINGHQSQNLARHRAMLEASLSELTGGVDRSELAIENSADALDLIRAATDRDILVQRLNIGARKLHAIRKALEALDRGEYGVCEDCEQPISTKRLDAVPWAPVCVKCQEARDLRNAEAGEEEDFAAAA